MRAVTWHGKRDVRVDDVPDPTIEQPTDAIIRVTSTGLCGSDLHLYEVMGPFMGEGDVLGHEPMGIVEEVGSAVTHIEAGDRVVIPFNIACGSCWMCDQHLYTQCETTQNREHGMGASLFGYTKLYGQVPGGQAEYLRVPQAHFGPIKVPDGPADDRFVYLSDVLPTDAVRRGGTISLSGVYGGQTDPLPMLTLFDKQIQLRMGQANVKRWIPEILPLLTGDGDPLGVDDFATHRLPLSEAPQAYETFQKKQDGAIKVVFKP